MKKLALKLLYQFRVMVNNSPGTYRKCEERYVIKDIVDDDIEATLDDFFANIKSSNHSFIDTYGHKVYCEFIGVMDYILLDEYNEEVWYDYCIKRLPMENKKKIIISKSEIKKRIRRIHNPQSPTPRLNPHVDIKRLKKSIQRYKLRHKQKD
jgi:hypothetical protein